MPEFKLHYFNLRGRAETTRLCFAATGVKYEDIRVTGEDWQQKKKEGFSPNGCLPVLEVDGKKLCESMAILRYVARECGLTPSDSFEIAQCDMVIDMGNDFIAKIVKFLFEKDEERKNQYKEEFGSTHLPGLMTKLNAMLKSNNGGQGFIVGSKLSYADIGIFQVCGIDAVQMVLNNYAELNGHCKRVGEIPGIKAWVENRPKTDR